MRLGFKLLVLAVILGALAAGLLPPLFQQGYLRNDASSAAQAGVDELLTPGTSAADARHSVMASVASHHGVRLSSLTVTSGEVSVTLKENVHTFMSGVPGLQGWFRVTVTQSASETGATA